MARCLFVPILVASLDAIIGKFGAFGATLHVEPSGWLRREVQQEPHVAGLSEQKTDQSVQEDDECMADFVIGEFGTENCEQDNHSHVNESEVCKLAQQEAIAQGFHVQAIDPDTFITRRGHGPVEGNVNRHPKKCYVAEKQLDNGDNTTEYHLNIVPDELPDQLQKTSQPNMSQAHEAPVCERPRHIYGKANSSDCGSDTFPNEYKLLENEHFCREAAKCMGLKPSPYFVVDELNASEHWNYPLGCFRSETNWVFYNNLSYLGSTGKAVAGTPLCIVKTVNFPIQ